MLQSFLTVGQQIITLYLLMVGGLRGWERQGCWMTAALWP